MQYNETILTCETRHLHVSAAVFLPNANAVCCTQFFSGNLHLAPGQDLSDYAMQHHFALKEMQRMGSSVI